MDVPIHPARQDESSHSSLAPQVNVPFSRPARRQRPDAGLPARAIRVIMAIHSLETR
jgi:hypothetical protein